jgi:hypothetical protein
VKTKFSVSKVLNIIDGLLLKLIKLSNSSRGVVEVIGVRGVIDNLQAIFV